MTGLRSIEHSFCLREASVDSVHEKNVRHGHISTLHIWPARRPLAAARAALVGALLPDPGSPEGRKRLWERVGGRVVHKVEKKRVRGRTVDVMRDETVGGVLHWGREAEPDVKLLRQEIRNAYGGRPPKVLDPFAGGGAIPLEAMRLGCEVTGIDISAVAWFLLRCTLDYPQRLAGQHRELPSFALSSREFMEEFFKGTAKLTRRQLERNLQAVQNDLFPAPAVDLSWHVRAWGSWVLLKARADLARFYPRIGGKPAVAYLWARTVTCKNCRATIPLLKTRWLCRKGGKRVLLTMGPDPGRTGVAFGVRDRLPEEGNNAAQRREHDRRLGQGTMGDSGAWCPCCGEPGTVAMEMEDIRREGRAGRLGAVMTAVVVDGPGGKEYRVPTVEEVRLAAEAESELVNAFTDIAFGIPGDPLPSKEALGFRVPLYGLDAWSKLFTPRQLLALGTFVKCTRSATEALRAGGYPADWVEAISAYLAAMLDRLANQSSTLSCWNQGGEKIEGTFARFALPLLWDFAEVNPLGETSGGYPSAFEWVRLAVGHLLRATKAAPPCRCLRRSAIEGPDGTYDLIVTDPPYYDAIPYSDLMDFFHVWLRRTLQGLSPEFDEAFRAPLGPKWNHDANDGELIDDSSRHGGDGATSKRAYEEGMFRAFQSCHQALRPYGRLVIVFAHKEPDAWETLVSAIIRAGFVVTASWPIQTERTARTRSLSSAALSSSVWLVCRKRPEDARAGWDNQVLQDMREKIYTRLREYWDAGIRGPDFVWAATGPALEAYSKHPVVKKADAPGEIMKVDEFLRAVRRIVVDFVVGRVLSRDGGEQASTGLDDLTTYYLLHRHDFGLDDAPIGPCILYAVSCGLSDRALTDEHDLLLRTGGKTEEEESASAEEADSEPEEGTGSRVRLRGWDQRRRKDLGHGPGGRPAPLIDQTHRLMHLWRSGDVVSVDEYLDAQGLRRNTLFHRLLQALIELARDQERSILESLSNHLAERKVAPVRREAELTWDPGTGQRD